MLLIELEVLQVLANKGRAGLSNTSLLGKGAGCTDANAADRARRHEGGRGVMKRAGIYERGEDVHSGGGLLEGWLHDPHAIPASSLALRGGYASMPKVSFGGGGLPMLLCSASLLTALGRDICWLQQPLC